MRSALADGSSASPADAPARRGRAALIASTVLVVVLGAVLWRCQTVDPYVTSPPRQAASTADPAAASAALDQLQKALRSGDAAAAADLGASPAAADLLAAAAANVESLSLADVTLRYLSESGAVVDGAWPAAVEVTWRFRGFEDDAAQGEVRFEFADGGATIGTIGGPEGLTPLWLQGRVASRSTDHALVLTTAGAARLTGYLEQASAAVDVVRGVVGGDPRLVVEVPASADAMHRAVGAEQDTYGEVAAVAASSDGTFADDSPLHVFLNPAVYDDLGDAAGQVVMSHEAVHVVTAAPLARSAPLWLLEGFADHVALREVALPLATTAGQISSRVRRDGVPETLPTRAEFDAEGRHLGATYEAAWLVCEVLADRAGAEALLGFYDAMLDGGELDQELRRWFDWGRAELVAAWQQRLRAVAETGGRGAGRVG